MRFQESQIVTLEVKSTPAHTAWGWHNENETTYRCGIETEETHKEHGFTTWLRAAFSAVNDLAMGGVVKVRDLKMLSVLQDLKCGTGTFYNKSYHALSHTEKKLSNGLRELLSKKPGVYFEFNLQPCVLSDVPWEGSTICDYAVENNIDTDERGIRPDVAIVYTDGSFLGRQKIAAAAWVNLLNKTNNYVILNCKGSGAALSELAAIELAVKDHIQSEYKNIILYSDCLTVVTALNNGRLSREDSPLQPGIGSIIAMRDTGDINLQVFWVKGHSGTTGNNVADKFARKAVHSARNGKVIKTTPQLVRKPITKQTLRNK